MFTSCHIHRLCFTVSSPTEKGRFLEDQMCWRLIRVTEAGKTGDCSSLSAGCLPAHLASSVPLCAVEKVAVNLCFVCIMLS